MRILRTATATRDLKLVPSSKFDMWCSKDCAKRAEYIRIQMSEMPAWERTEGTNRHYSLFSLLDHDVSSTRTLKSQTNTLAQEKRDAMTELARERGDQSAQPILQPEIPQPQSREGLEPAKPTAFPIRERVQVSTADPPRQDVNSAGDIEGYIPKIQPHKPTTSKDDDEDAEDADWTFE